MRISTRSLALLVSFTTALGVSAQEIMESAEARRNAHKLYETLGSPSDAPYATDVDPDKPQGIKAGGAGLMVLPDRKLTSDALAHASDQVTPVGQLWTLEINVAADGRPVANDKVRFVQVSDGQKSKDVQLYFLGARKGSDGELELVIYAKDKAQPVHHVALKKAARLTQSSPIEVEGRKQDENTGILTVHLLGEYSAEIPVMKPE